MGLIKSFITVKHDAKHFLANCKPSNCVYKRLLDVESIY